MEYRQYYKILKKRLLLILLLPIFASIVTLTISCFFIKPAYESVTTLYIINRNADSNVPITYDNIMTNQYLIKDYREIAKSTTVAKMVIKELNLKKISPDSLSKKVRVELRNDTRILEISVQNENPQLARKTADKISEIFIKKVAEMMNVSNINIVDPPEDPVEPVSPKPVFNTVVAFLTALFASLGISLLIEYLDDTIKTTEDVEKFIGTKVIGKIPVMNIE
jgi:capsular polysaccharide biosynthesis protein